MFRRKRISSLKIPSNPPTSFLSRLLSDEKGQEELFQSAHELLLRELGDAVYLRGLIEVSNRCGKNCLYCGLRSDNRGVDRYAMTLDEIIDCLLRGHSAGLRSFLLQSGELPSRDQIDLTKSVLQWCSSEIPEDRIVLSMGELPNSVYDEFRNAGAARYLLRIETSSEELYRRFHPSDHDYFNRLRCLEYLRDSGWQTGTGVLIGLPGQDAGHLADDLRFMKDMNVDMIGMGPYIEHPDTPMMKFARTLPSKSARRDLTLRMIALARLTMPFVNIAATTALQTISGKGLILGLRAGANVVMPNLTPARYRENYNLYTGKIMVEDSLEEILERLSGACREVGRRMVTEDPGDPVHYGKRMSRTGN
jgi:biotin synthase